MGVKEIIAPRLILIAGGLLLALLFLGDWLQHSPSAQEGDQSWIPRAERTAFRSEATLTTLDGKRLTLDDVSDEVVFLNFWATWCRPCREEMPSMANLADKFAARGLRVLAVTDEPAETVRSFLEANPYPFEILIDRGGQLAGEVGVIVLPSTLILDRQHGLVRTHQGALSWDTPQLLARFDRLLAEK